MTTDASEVPPLVPVSEPEYSRQPSLDGEQATLLDIAGMLSLTRTDSEGVVTDAIARMLDAHSAEIDANGAWRRARMAGEIQALDYEIVQRTQLRDELPALRTRREELRTQCNALRTTVASLEGQLILRRQTAEDEQLAAQLAALREEEAEAQKRAANVADEQLPAEEASARREESVRLLEQKYRQVLEAETPAIERAQRLADRAITQTVAGFLLWLGYGSVAATGAVLALMMNGGDGWQFGIIVDGWRSIVESFSITAVWGRLLLGVGLAALLLLLLGLVIVAADRLLKKRPDWTSEKQRSGDPQVNLSPQSITSRTYTQFIALLPFLFAAGMICTILALTPIPRTGDDTNVLTSVLPTLGYAFVGIVIAFLATAVFVMYVIRIIEPRQEPAEGRGVLRAAWEFVVPPLILIIAVAATPAILPSISAKAWSLWAGFMLLASLALACGVVYHGVFKDARKARDRVDEIEARLDIERGLLAAPPPVRDETIRRSYEEELRRLQNLQRDLRLRRLGVAITGRSEDGSVLARVWHSIRRQRTVRELSDLPVVAEGIATGYRPIDYAVSGDLIAELEKARTERDSATTDLDAVEQSIRRREALTSFEVMTALARRCELLKGDREASTSEDAERKKRAAVMGEVLMLHARSVVSSGTSVKPFFDGVRQDLSKRIPYALVEAPAVEDSHE